MVAIESTSPKPDTPATRGIIPSLVITFVALIAIRLLHHIPIVGIADVLARISFVPAPTYSIAAVALKSWLTASAWIQLLVVILPQRWTLHLIRDGYINPFGVIVLLVTSGLACSHAYGVVTALGAMTDQPTNQSFHLLAIGSLVAGTAAFVALAWVIDRFGIGYGFWIAIAIQTTLETSTTMLQWFSMLGFGTFAPTTIITAGAILVAMVTLIVLITLHARSHGGSLELVVWPLLVVVVVSYPATSLLLDVLAFDDRMRVFPGILIILVPVTLLVLGAITFSLTRRDAQSHLFIPILSALALIETAAFVIELTPGGLSSPAPTGALVVTVALFAVLVQQLWQAFRASPQNP